MLIELLSMSNYVHFNVKLAEILGLHTAIYLGQITDINEKAIRKNKVDENFFTIDREYITKRTTIPEKEQKEIENNLIKIGILERSNKDANTLLLNLTVLTSIGMAIPSFFFAVLLAARPRHRYICLVTAVCFSIGVNRGSSSDVPQMSV